MRLLYREDLRAKGIKFSRQHLDRLVKKKKFPKPIKVGLVTNAWIDDEIDQYLEECVAARDADQDAAA
jgi:prophage regulatory protein